MIPVTIDDINMEKICKNNDVKHIIFRDVGLVKYISEDDVVHGASNFEVFAGNATTEQ